MVQPLIGKQLLPLAGGTPAVWTTCLVLFQALLLAAYAYADGATKLRPRAQRVLHLLLLGAGAAWLVFGGMLAPRAELFPADATTPLLPLLLVVFLAVAGPYAVLSTTAPLLQSWFAKISHNNPYPLYAASNAGSFVGLVSYPFLVEPYLTLAEQRLAWSLGFAVCVGLIVVCGLIPIRKLEPYAAAPESTDIPLSLPAWKCLAYAALPSSLLVSVSTHLTTDLAPMPLLWVVPLGLYLLSFVWVFASWPPRARRFAGRVVPMILCFLIVALLTGATEPIVLVALVHLSALVGVALLCHGELATHRPPPSGLTRFYFLISLGGVLGGLLTAVVAPIVFQNFGNLEYPIAVLLAALVRPPDAISTPHRKRSDAIWPLALGAFTAFLVVGLPIVLGEPDAADPAAELINRVVRGGLSFGIPAAIAFALVWRPVRFALCLTGVYLAGSLAPSGHGKVLQTERNFFGTLRITQSDDGQFTRIVHGTTQHGQQFTNQRTRPEPLMYYHRKGPLGRLFAGAPRPWPKVGVVGLGCGAMAAYAQPGDAWDFYEINPTVVRFANDTRYFTYLEQCQGTTRIILGDARRQLLNAPDAGYDLLVLDAFSSDAVPAHLLTREAFALYRQKLRPDGVLALHVSNRYLDLVPLVARLAIDGDARCVVRVDADLDVGEQEKAQGKFPSIWVFIAPTIDALGKQTAARQPVAPTPGPLWTDDHSNLLSVWRHDE